MDSLLSVILQAAIQPMSIVLLNTFCCNKSVYLFSCLILYHVVKHDDFVLYLKYPHLHALYTAPLPIAVLIRACCICSVQLLC